MKRFILMAAYLVLIFATQRAGAATLTVNTNTDPDISTANICSLRQAIQAANTDLPVGNCGAGDFGLDTIQFANPNDTFSLTINPTYTDNTEGDLDICSDITINGGGIGVTIVRAAFTVGNDRVMQILDSTTNPFGCFTPPNGVVAGQGNDDPIVILNGLTIENGGAEDTFNSAFGGGGILNAGFLTINDSEIRNNTADNTNNNDENAFGGGILHLNTTVINRSQIHDNTVRSISFANNFFAAGGGIATAPADVACTSANCDLEITDSSIFNNTADNGSGGGIAQFGAGGELLNVSVLRSAVYDNQVTGTSGNPLGLPQFGTGGGIAVLLAIGQVTPPASPTSFLFVDSTLSGNTAVKDGGGWIEVSSDFSVNQILSSTIAENSAGTSGGGIKIHRDSLPGGSLEMMNSILSDNTAGLGPDCNSDDPGEPLTSIGWNLIFDTTGCTLDGAQTDDVPPGNDPLLGALTNNGGLTPTHALTFGSPAIDTARPEADGGCVDNLNGGAALPFDQRNDPFLRVVAGVVGGTPRCDIGAFEFQPTTITGTKTADVTIVDAGDTFTYTLTVTNVGPGTATNVVLTDDLPAGATFVGFGTVSQGTCNQAGGVVTCNIGTLDVGETATVEIDVTVSATCTTLTNQGQITADEVDAANPVLTNQVVTPCSTPSNLLIEGSGIHCGLQRAEATQHPSLTLLGILGFTLVALGMLRSRRGR